MSVRWTRKAFADLDSIFEAIALDRPLAAARVLRALMAAGEKLLDHPHRGRPGRLRDTRELVAPGLPYVLVYAVNASLVHIKPDIIVLRVVHGAMRWPPRSAAGG